MSNEKWTKKNIPDLTGKAALITGGNSGLGLESAKAFSEKGAEVVLTSRSMEKGESAKQEILNKFPEAKIRVMQLDLMDLASVRSFAEEFKKQYDKLDILQNNAGIMTVPYGLTKDGFESQMGTNHLGHFALTSHLLDLIKKTPGARVVNVSSNAHKQGKMDFDNLLFENGKDYSRIKAYARSKLANLLFTYELQRRFEQHGIDAISVAAHPGVSQTNLARHIENMLIFKILRPFLMKMTQTAEMGALPQIRASVDPDVRGGEYYGPDGKNEMKGYPVKVKSTPASHNKEDAEKLWKASEELTGVKYNF